jgi:hypothetical protein
MRDRLGLCLFYLWSVILSLTTASSVVLLGNARVYYWCVAVSFVSQMVQKRTLLDIYYKLKAINSLKIARVALRALMQPGASTVLHK